MMKKLNELSREEIKEVENYVLENIESKRVIRFFELLKMGELKDKNISTEVLDHIYSGLSTWVKQALQKLYIKDLLSNKITVNIEITKEQMKNRIRELLKRNGFPERSKNLLFKEPLEPNDKFIKDGYIYLFKAGPKDQQIGFFSYSYVRNVSNISEKIKERPNNTLEKIYYEQSTNGNKGAFILATTNLFRAEQSASKYDDGRVYVIKVKVEDVYKTFHESIGLHLDLPWGEINNEYLIPDCIYPDEICEEFRQYEYIKIFDYLIDKIGLRLKPEDIGLPEVSERIEKMDKKLSEENKNISFGNSSDDGR